VDLDMRTDVDCSGEGNNYSGGGGDEVEHKRAMA
jgi:hypothetical protein